MYFLLSHDLTYRGKKYIILYISIVNTTLSHTHTYVHSFSKLLHISTLTYICTPTYMHMYTYEKPIRMHTYISTNLMFFDSHRSAIHVLELKYLFEMKNKKSNKLHRTRPNMLFRIIGWLAI